MNETSTTANAQGSGMRSGGMRRMLVRSMTTTRGSEASFQSSWPCPTSMQYTRRAPRWSRQSVKPPVEAPTSTATRSFTSSPKVTSACANLIPPRETKGMGSPRRRSAACAPTKSPALSTGRSPSSTWPARMSALAFSRVGASPCSTSARSARTRPARALVAAGLGAGSASGLRWRAMVREENRLPGVPGCKPDRHKYNPLTRSGGVWGCSSAGRALESHSRGRGFDPHQLH